MTDRATLTVRGTASLDGEIAALTVGGVPATSDDGFLHWSAVVPLSLGVQTVAVEVTGPSVAELPSVSVDRRAILGHDPKLLAVDEVGGRAFTARGVAGSDTVIVAIDLATGEQTELSSATAGVGPAFDDDLYTLSWDEAGQRLIAFDVDDLWAIDADSGARTILYSKPAGGPPWPGEDNEAQVDSAQNRVIASTDSDEPLIAIDLSAPAITVLSRNGLNPPAIGGGPDLDDVRGMALDLANDRAIVVDDSTDTGVATIDLSTGDRALVSNQSLGLGPVPVLPQRLAASGGKAWVSNLVGAEVVEVDLSTGNRSYVMQSLVGSVGTGPVIPTTSALEHDGQGLLVTSPHLDALIAVDPLTLERTVVSSYGLGAGPSLWEPFGLAWDPQAGLAVVDFAGVVTIDPANGTREVVSSAYLGVGEGLYGITFSSHLEVGPDAYFGLNNTGIVRVERATGDRSILSGIDGGQLVGGGPEPAPMRGLSLSPDGQLLWIVDVEGTVMSVDPQTGDRAIVSGATVGAGPTITTPRDLVHDADRDRVLVSTDTGLVVAVDLASGDRTEFSGPNVGEGPLAFGDAILRGEGLYLAYGHDWTLFDLDTGDRTRVVEDGVGPGYYGSGHAVGPDGLFYASDHILGAELVIDPVSGERVIWSR